jgi:hypothetical protein
VDHEDASRVGSDDEFFVGKSEFANRRVVESFGAGPVGPDVMSAPEVPEHLAARGQLTDEVLEAFVVGITAGLDPHDRHAHLSEKLPVRIEVPGRRVQELEPGQVRRATAGADEGRIEGLAELIGGRKVLMLVANEGNAVGDLLSTQCRLGPTDCGFCGSSAGTPG